MEQGRYYTTIGCVYDHIVAACGGGDRRISFPEALDELRAAGRLSDRCPELPPFRSGMDRDGFSAFVRGLPIRADPILPESRTYITDPRVGELTVFRPGQDVACYLNMPYMEDYLHSHEYFEITYVVTGCCTHLFEDEQSTLSEGDLCIVSPGSRHSLPLEPGCMALSLAVRGSTFDRTFGRLLGRKDLVSLFFRNSLYGDRRSNYVLLKTGADPLTLQTVQQLTYESNLMDDYSNRCAVNLLELTLARALRAARAAITLHHYEGYGRQELDFALVLQYIQKNYRTVTLASLSDAFHFSGSYLSRLIRRNLNQSFTDTLRGLKMDHALELLLNTSANICEIADAVGYDSPDHFSRTFRRVYGLTPRAYRKRHTSAGKQGGPPPSAAGTADAFPLEK